MSQREREKEWSEEQTRQSIRVCFSAVSCPLNNLRLSHSYQQGTAYVCAVSPSARPWGHPRQKKNQAPARIELATPGLQDQCSNH